MNPLRHVLVVLSDRAGYWASSLPRKIIRVILTLVAFGWCIGSATGADNSTDLYVPDNLIVVFKSDASETEKDALENNHGDEKLGRLEGINGRLVRIRGNRSVARAMREYQGSAKVLFAEPNYLLHLVATPDDALFSTQWSLNNTGQSSGTSGADIKAESAWSITTGTTNVVVGVVDTGIAYDHPDLAANVWVNPGGISGGTAGSHGYNAITKSYDPLDDNGHGTHVAGTIGAVGNNQLGVAGVNWTTSIMGLKFLDANGIGTTAGAIAAIDFAIKAKQAGVNVRVLNNSWGGGGASQALLAEINKANANDILFVLAAGNAGADIDAVPDYPASYRTSNMITVAATDRNDLLAGFSNYGIQSVHLGAPGVAIVSTYSTDTYATGSGTSMATPHVSGAAALLLARGYQSVATLKSNLLNNVDPIPSLAGKTVTAGRLNVYRALVAGHDITGPTVAAYAVPSPNGLGWNNTDVTVHITAADEAGGSGVASITYSASGAATVDATTVNGSAASLPVISTEGITTVNYHAADIAGNLSGPQTNAVYLDVTAPVVTAGVTPSSAARNNGPRNPSITVTVSGLVADALSGLDTSTGAGTFSVLDSQGTIMPSRTFTVAADGTYSFTIRFPLANRSRGVRTYSITVQPKDKADNLSSVVTTFTVL